MSSVKSVSLNCLAANTVKPIGVERFVSNVISGIRLGDISVKCFARSSVKNFDQLFDSRFVENNSRARLRGIPVGSTISRILIEMAILPFFTFKDDVVLSINNFGPLWGKSAQSRILIVHDVWFMSPEYDGGLLQKWIFKMLLGLQLRCCSRIITVSDFSKREINRFFGVPSDKIHLVSNCVGKIIEVTTEKDPSNRLLLVGSDRKNKNAFRSIEGFCEFRNSNPDSQVRLVVVGKYSEEFFRKLKRSFPEHLPYIELAGYVDEAKLESLYRQCVGVLFLSLYEGFGLPAVEGLLFGKPVLVSRNTACAEILEDFAIAVDATSTTCISEGIAELVESSVNSASPEFEEFQRKYMHCEKQSKVLTSILRGNEFTADL